MLISTTLLVPVVMGRGRRHGGCDLCVVLTKSPRVFGCAAALVEKSRSGIGHMQSLRHAYIDEIDLVVRTRG
jgi:hypothetical protein